MNLATLQTELLDHLTTAVLVLGAELDVLYLNHAAEALLECSDQRATGQPFAALLRGPDGDTQELARDIANESPFTQRSTTLVLLSGKELTVDLAVTLLEHPSAGSVGRYVLELQSLDRILRISRGDTQLASQSTSRSLVRGLAHEIKNPLGGLRGAAQLLSRELKDPALEDYTTVIIEEADRLSNLVDQILGPHQVPDIKAVNVHEVLERVATLVQAENHHALRILRDYDPSIPEIQADFEQLIQAVLNIMRNGKQALATLGPEHDSEISLRTRIIRQFTIGKKRHKLVVRVDICDNGPGIDDDLLASIFYPMVSGRPDGTGLGLSIAQSIIHQHQGLIECESKGGTTRFTLYIPLESDSDELNDKR